jgi:hypothetical protein
VSYQGDDYQFKHDPVFVYDENDPRSYADQRETWLVCRDTTACDIHTYPGTAEERGTQKPVYKVVTKRRR